MATSTGMTGFDCSLVVMKEYSCAQEALKVRSRFEECSCAEVAQKARSYDPRAPKLACQFGRQVQKRGCSCGLHCPSSTMAAGSVQLHSAAVVRNRSYLCWEEVVMPLVAG